MELRHSSKQIVNFNRLETHLWWAFVSLLLLVAAVAGQQQPCLAQLPTHCLLHSHPLGGSL